MALSRVNFEPTANAFYGGWYPLQPGVRSYKEGIDIGPDIAHADLPVTDDVLRERTPLPDLPEWRAAGKRWYLAMEAVGDALMRAIARTLGVAEDIFAPLFRLGISSFRLAHYPVRSAASFGGENPALAEVNHQGEVLHLSGAAHVDSGFVTLLVQDGVLGLQVHVADEWVAAPPIEGTIVVSFGALLDKWSGERIKATRHRVVSQGGRSGFRSRSFMNQHLTPLSARCHCRGPRSLSRSTMGITCGRRRRNLSNNAARLICENLWAGQVNREGAANAPSSQSLYNIPALTTVTVDHLRLR